ncbi:MAG: HAD-IIB family hydrolase, partial [Eubacteriales bacterium]
TGDPDILVPMEQELKSKYHSVLNIFRSEPYFLEIMPQKIDKAHSLQRLLSSLNLTSDEMICCGDGYNDLTMIEYAGLGVAMANAQPTVLDKADYITKSNDEDGILHVIEEFML